MSSAQPEKSTAEPSWYDELILAIDEQLNTSVRTLDGIFNDDALIVDEEATAQGRISLFWEPRTRDLSEIGMRFKVRVSMPNVSKRLDLVLSDVDEEQPDNKVNAVNDSLQDRDQRLNLSFRLRTRSESPFSSSIGLGRGLQPYLKGRYRDGFSLTNSLDISWKSSLYYYLEDGVGADAGVTFDFQSDQDVFWRQDNQFYYRGEDEQSGWVWEHSLRRYHQVSAKTAYFYNYYIQGSSEPEYQIDQHLLSVRIRQNALRDWLYFELEPFILWEREERFDASYGVGFRIEGYFG